MMSMLRHLGWALSVLFFLLSVGGCFSRSGESEAGIADSIQADDKEKPPFEAFISGSIVDTVSGRARFGIVTDTRSGRPIYLLELESRDDFAGGVYITRNDTILPNPGTYSLANKADSANTLQPGRFVISYIKDLSRKMYSQSGSLTLDVVTDTLITGSFESRIKGQVRESGFPMETRTVDLRGRFEAKRGTVGFVVGL